MLKKKTIEDLNSFYESVTSSSKDLFAEQRSNSMLVAGNHYSGKMSDSWNRIRDLRTTSADQKLRLTKNHIKKITNTYINNLVSTSPSVKIIPRDDKSNQSRKAAELNDAVWQFAVDTQELAVKTLNWASDYIELGEVAVKVFWNPMVGEIVGYNQKLDDNGQPMVDEMGQPVADETSPAFSGQLQFEQITPTNLGMDLNCSNFEDCPMVFVRKMMPTDRVKKLVGNDADKLKMIQEDKKDETMIFDPSSAEYQTAKGQTLIVEYYIRPCDDYPKGYYYITTKNGILFDGELPFGIFPIEYAGFDKIQGNPRHKSIIKQLRPYQLEINRTASKIAEHQITSDDKLMMQTGTKLSSGSTLAGVRVFQYSGSEPKYLEGRSGAQYLDYMASQISEMYQVANVTEDSELKVDKGADPLGLLFRSVKDQKKFIIYSEKFEYFLKRSTKLYLSLAKNYLDEKDLIPMLGKSEYVNIAEFKNTKPLDTSIKVIPMVDDINTMFGKWISINHMIQYSAAQLGKEDIARIAKNMPFGNFDESFADIMLDYDLAQNFMLAVERGEQPEPSQADNKEYMIKKLENRIRQSDFVLLEPQTQQYYQQVLSIYKDMAVQEKLELQRAESGFIPTTGPLVRTDLKTEVPNAEGGMKTVSKSFPIDALAWLEKQMTAQGASLESLQSLNQSAQADIASRLNQINPPSDVGNINAPSLLSNVGTQAQNVATKPQGALNGNGIGRTNQFSRNPNQ